MKKEKTKLIIWALVALVIGVVIGLLIINVTTGNATKVNRYLNSITTKTLIGEKLYDTQTGDVILTKEGESYRIASGYTGKKVGDNTIEIYDLRGVPQTMILCTCPMIAGNGSCTDACTTSMDLGQLANCSGTCSGSMCSTNGCRSFELTVTSIK